MHLRGTNTVRRILHYSRKEKRIRFILKFGSVFVSAVRFCDVSAGVSAGDSAVFLPSPSTTELTFVTYFISFDFPLQARPNVAKPLKVMKQQSLTMTFSFFFLFFLFFPYHSISFPSISFHFLEAGTTKKTKKNFPKIWRPKVVKPLSRQNTRKNPKLGQNSSPSSFP